MCMKLKKNFSEAFPVAFVDVKDVSLDTELASEHRRE